MTDGVKTPSRRVTWSKIPDIIEGVKSPYGGWTGWTGSNRNFSKTEKGAIVSTNEIILLT